MKKWGERKTLLIVGEGLHDEAFLQHVKRGLVERGCGLEVAIKNARGKGAKNVVEYTIRHSKNAQYDNKAAMVDSDTDFDEKIVALAKRNKITLIVAEPCFEALLLRAIGERPGEPKQLKKQFAPFVNNDPTNSKNYERHFGVRSLLKVQEEALVRLLELFPALKE